MRGLDLHKKLDRIDHQTQFRQQKHCEKFWTANVNVAEWRYNPEVVQALRRNLKVGSQTSRHYEKIWLIRKCELIQLP